MDEQLIAPPVLYLPVETDGDGQVADIKMIKLADGRVALLGYTALDRFIDARGEHQPGCSSTATGSPTSTTRSPTT